MLFGDAAGRIGEGGARRTLTQTDLDETPEAGDHFGWAVELNRTDSGGCFGILIGSPGRTWADRLTPEWRTFSPSLRSSRTVPTRTGW